MTQKYTSIRLTQKTLKRLHKLKKYPREPIEEVILRMTRVYDNYTGVKNDQ